MTVYGSIVEHYHLIPVWIVYHHGLILSYQYPLVAIHFVHHLHRVLSLLALLDVVFYMSPLAV